MTIELPKDVEGREIPLDTTKLFGASGDAYNITRSWFAEILPISRTRCVPTRAISVRSAPNASSTQGIALSICAKTSRLASIS